VFLKSRRGIGRFLLWLPWWPAGAQLPQSVLNHVFPAGSAAGTTNEITVGASELEDPGAMVFSDPRIVGEPKVGAAGVYRVVVPPGVPSGIVDVRVTGRFGVSNPRSFLVETVGARVQQATNVTPATAAPLDRGAAAWSRLSAANRSVFRLEARKDERIRVRVQAAELDSRLVPDLAAFDAQGREIARSRRSGLIDFRASTDGACRVEVNDLQYRGGEDYHFRIERLEGPQVELAVPVGLRLGETNAVTLFGRGLPGGRPSTLKGADGVALERVEVSVVAPKSLPAEARDWPVAMGRRPSSVTAALWSWTWPTTNGVSNPIGFVLGERPIVGGADPAVPGLVPIQPPVDFSGVFPRGGEISGVTFSAKKGDAYWMEVVGDRLGNVVDPAVVVQRRRSTPDAAGKPQFSDVLELGELDSNPGGVEFAVASRDVAGRFEAPEDGEYRVVVRDLFNTSASAPRRPYRLSVRRATPEFRLFAWSQPPPKSNGEDRRLHLTVPVLRRGGTLPVRVAVSRFDGFDGPVEVVAEGLPAGVRCEPARIAAGTSSGTLLLTASDSVVAGQFSLRLTGRGVVGTNRIERIARSGGARWTVADSNQDAAVYRLWQEFRVGIAPEDEPVVVGALEDRVYEVKVGTKLAVPLRVGRRQEFPAAFNLKPAGFAAIDKAKEFSVPEKATNVVFELNLAEVALPEGEHAFWLQGQVAGKYRNQPEAIGVADADFKAAEASLKTATAEQKPAIEQRRKEAEARRKAAEERAKPRDVTMGVWSAPIRVKVLPAK